MIKAKAFFISCLTLLFYSCWSLDSEYDPSSPSYVLQEPTIQLSLNGSKVNLIGSSVYPVVSTNVMISNLGKQDLIISSLTPSSAITLPISVPKTVKLGTPLEFVINYATLSSNASFTIKSNASNGDCVITLVDFN